MAEGHRERGPFHLAPALTLFLLLVPIVAGLVGTLLPALGYFPVVGAYDFSLEPWHLCHQSIIFLFILHVVSIGT